MNTVNYGSLLRSQNRMHEDRDLYIESEGHTSPKIKINIHL